MRATCSSTTEAADQVMSQPQMPSRNVFSTALP
jgi:hypothetical protein